MNGSSDPYYRYTMPCISVKVEGTTKMIKSVLVNIDDVCRAIGRPPDYLLTYLGQELSANSKIDKDKHYITGACDERQVQQLIFKFIQGYVTCGSCKNPETTVHIEGSKKQKILYLTCKGCGQRTDLNETERFVKYMILHPPTDANYGHAKSAAGAVGKAMAEATAMDEEAKKKKKKGKEDDDEDDEDKKEKKKKKKKEKKDDEDEDEDDEDKKEKKKKKKKDKKEDGDEDGSDSDEKEKKKKKKKDKKDKKKDDDNDSWDDDWGDVDLSEEAVAKRQAAAMGAAGDADAIAEKLEKSLKAQEEDDSNSKADNAPAPAPANDDDDDDDLDIDDI
eukprot:CAMPEP_0184292512 /NCGR_PEP_ID=MMETSP1049-20130417/4275_1 /TAXON_ID=77928 /ORGANISM="Proteomonas sulcata, Strain CCMP704" /LENGTH=333 /DNA_ID=CAMNT_0026600311 /DNA_START=117 /DNA_END=1118 /DNA_ORIENTATION=-